MNTQPKTLPLYEVEMPIILIRPEPEIFKNTIKTWRWWRRKQRIVFLTWNESYDRSGKKSFLPIFTNAKGIEYMNQVIAETYLEIPIEIPEITQCTRSITYQGHCSKCGRFHIEDNGLIVLLVGKKSDINAPTITLPENEECEKYSTCKAIECGGTVQKNIHIR
jgi:hypothetical protein